MKKFPKNDERSKKIIRLKIEEKPVQMQKYTFQIC